MLNRRRTPAGSWLTVTAVVVPFLCADFSSAAQGCFPPPDGIVSWWSMDAVEGGLVLDLVGDNAGSLMNGALLVPGLSGNGLMLDGIDDYMVVPDSTDLRITDALTIEAWVYFRAFGPLEGAPTAILHKDPQSDGDRAFSVVAGNTGFIDFFVCGDGTAQTGARQRSAVPLALGAFQHVACVYQGGATPTLEVYINGVLSLGDHYYGSGTIPSSIHPNSHPVFIGGYVAGVHPYPMPLNGMVDEATIYNRALSAEEIAAVYAAGTDGKCRSLDSDGDGLDDASEAGLGTDPSDPDSDNDDLTDGEEAHTYLTDPLNSDTDGDGVMDGADPLPLDASQGCFPPPGGIVSWWSMDAVEGGLVLDLVSNNAGSLMNGALLASGLSGHGLMLDGIDDYMVVPDSADLRITDALTIEAWVYFRAFNPLEGYATAILHKDPQSDGDRAFSVVAGNAGFIDFFVCGDGTAQTGARQRSAVPIALGAFQHVACVYQGGATPTLEVYINGVLSLGDHYYGSGTIPSSIHPNSHPVFIGGYVAGVHPYPMPLNGMVDEATIYNRALSAEEIAAVYAAGTDGKCRSLDSDGDGLDDSVEATLGTDPSSPDTDGDGLTDGDEVLTYITNPLAADTDGDGLSDGSELTLQEFGCPDPLEADTDTDGLSDGDELILYETDPCDDADLDGDGLMDGQEILDYGTDWLDEDTDDDGLFDGTEVDMAAGTGCPDPLVADSDGDSLQDGAEVSLGTDPCKADTDGDGVPDDTDDQPTDPGVSSGFIESDLRALCDYITGLSLEHFAAPNDNARRGRRNAMCNKLHAAAQAVAEGDYQEAYDQLESLSQKLDDADQPPDWMVRLAEDAKTTVHGEIEFMLSLIVYDL